MSIKGIFARKALAAVIGVLLFLVLLEGGLRLAGHMIMSEQDKINRAALADAGAYRILCLGDSMTAVGGEWSYPSQLQEELNSRSKDFKVSVINKGIVDATSAEILEQLDQNLDLYKPDIVIVMMGIMDRGGVTVFGEAAYEKEGSFLSSLRIYRLAELLRCQIVNRIKGVKLPPIVKEDIQGTEGAGKRESILLDHIENNPDNAEAYAELGRFYAKIYRYGDAEAMYARAIEIDPTRARYYMELGKMYKPDKAERFLDRAIELDPGNGILYQEAGEYFFAIEQLEKAEEMLERGLEADPHNEGIYLRLSSFYIKQGKYNEAEDILEKGIEKNEGYYRLYSALAEIYKESGRMDEAEGYYALAEEKERKFLSGTKKNYRALKYIVTGRGIKLVCMQYPLRDVGTLRKMLGPSEGVIFIDNEKNFKEAMDGSRYKEYFWDRFARDLGHCTAKGNRLIAENAANVLMEEYFGKLPVEAKRAKGGE